MVRGQKRLFGVLRGGCGRLCVERRISGRGRRGRGRRGRGLTMMMRRRRKIGIEEGFCWRMKKKKRNADMLVVMVMVIAG